MHLLGTHRSQQTACVCNNGGVTGFLGSLKISPCEERRLKETLSLKCEDRRFQNFPVLKTEDLATKPTKSEDLNS